MSVMLAAPLITRPEDLGLHMTRTCEDISAESPGLFRGNAWFTFALHLQGSDQAVIDSGLSLRIVGVC